MPDHDPQPGDGVLATTREPHHDLPGDGVLVEHDAEPAHDAPVYSPDQLKPFNRKAARIGVLGTCVALLAFTSDNRQYHVGQYVCLLAVIGLLVTVAVDWWARKNGLSRRD